MKNNICSKARGEIGVWKTTCENRRMLAMWAKNERPESEADGEPLQSEWTEEETP